jgi:hypothetical protein
MEMTLEPRDFASAFETTEPLVHGVTERGFRIATADSSRERNSASSLINRRYASRGYKSNPIFDGSELDQLTLVTSDHDEVIGTLTIGFDSDRGLLAEELFPDEIDALRASGRRVCEFTKLAIDSEVRSQRVLAAMFHVAFIYAHRIRGCDNLLIEVNPRHTRYYEAKLGFTSVGPERLNRRVNAPAVLLSLDLWHAHEQINKFGGRSTLATAEKTLYSYGFSDIEEAGILKRLRQAVDQRFVRA